MVDRRSSGRSSLGGKMLRVGDERGRYDVVKRTDLVNARESISGLDTARGILNALPLDIAGAPVTY